MGRRKKAEGGVVSIRGECRRREGVWGRIEMEYRWKWSANGNGNGNRNEGENEDGGWWTETEMETGQHCDMPLVPLQVASVIV